MELVKEYKNYILKLKTNEKDICRYDYKDLLLEIYKDDKLIKTYKIIHDFTFWIKIQKTQIRAMDILDFWEKINNPNELYLSYFLLHIFQ